MDVGQNPDSVCTRRELPCGAGKKRATKLQNLVPLALALEKPTEQGPDCPLKISERSGVSLFAHP